MFISGDDLRVVAVLRTINFDYQATLAATEVHDIIAYRKLATKVKPAHLLPAETMPKCLLRCRLGTPQPTRQLMYAST